VAPDWQASLAPRKLEEAYRAQEVEEIHELALEPEDVHTLLDACQARSDVCFRPAEWL